MAPMANLRLPLWFAFDRQPKVLPEQAPCDDPGSTLAFSTTEKLIAFLGARQAGKWKLELGGDAQSLLGMVADFHQRGHVQVCLDPEPDERGGESVSLGDLLEFTDTLGNDQAISRKVVRQCTATAS
jgi:hypothetical protein